MQLAGVVELTSGVDALYLSGRAALSDDFLARLDALRRIADEQEGPVNLVLGGLEMQMQPRKWGLYRYCVDHPYARFGFSPKQRIPAIRVQPRAEFLHGAGVEEVVEWARHLLESECGAVHLQVARIDLFADFQGWNISGDQRHEFLCRADARNLFETAQEFNGLKIGKRESGTISVRLYDKTVESAKTGTAYWKELWGEAYDPALPVLRVEFELHREVLRQFGVSTPEEVLGATGSMWHYLTHEWLTHRVPTDDETRSRWPLSEPWQGVQRARIAGRCPRDRTRLRRQARWGSGQPHALSRRPAGELRRTHQFRVAHRLDSEPATRGQSVLADYGTLDDLAHR